MIDIHSHILPGLDDGAQNMGEAVEMARIAAEDGTKVLFATPHIAAEISLSLAAEIPGRTAQLQSMLDEQEIDIKLIPGAEVYPISSIVESLDKGAPLLLGESHCMLLDAPLSQLPDGFDQLVNDLQSRGITAILAHPERVRVIQKNPQSLEDLVHKGLLLQVNALSVVGGHGSVARRTAETLIRHKWVQLIASDAHSPHTRKPGLGEAEQVLMEIAGDETAREMTRVNGGRILSGEPIPADPLPYTPDHHKRWFGIFGGHS